MRKYASYLFFCAALGLAMLLYLGLDTKMPQFRTSTFVMSEPTNPLEDNDKPTDRGHKESIDSRLAISDHRAESRDYMPNVRR